MPKQEKIERVAELKERIEGSDALLLAEYRGLTVSEITELRRSLAEGGTKFQVVKNTLMRRAVNDAGVAELEVLLEGPSAVAFVQGDPVAAAKSVVDAAKKYPTLELKGGFMDGKMLSSDDAKALSKLESREEMLSKFVGLVKSEMSKAAALFVGAQSKFVSLLEAYKDKLPGEEVAEAPAEPEAAEPDASEPEAAEPEAAEPEASAEPQPEADATPAEAGDETTEAEASSAEEE